jgi:hypothetical protein
MPGVFPTVGGLSLATPADTDDDAPASTAVITGTGTGGGKGGHVSPGSPTGSVSVSHEGSAAALAAEAEALLQDLTWTATRSDGRVVELVPDGANRPVLLGDIERYLQLYVEARLSEGKMAVQAFREGLAAIVPESAYVLLGWEDMQRVVCGARSIDVARLKANTEYDDELTADDPHIVAFWDVLEHDFSEEEKSAFLRFVWARPTLPPKGVEFSQKMKVQSAVGEDVLLKPDQYLPKAHTCFFSINLPRYSSKEVTHTRARHTCIPFLRYLPWGY